MPPRLPLPPPPADLNTPMAPELGLFLDECFFDSYNKQWGGLHSELGQAEFEAEVEAFKVRRAALSQHAALRCWPVLLRCALLRCALLRCAVWGVLRAVSLPWAVAAPKVRRAAFSQRPPCSPVQRCRAALCM